MKPAVERRPHIADTVYVEALRAKLKLSSYAGGCCSFNLFSLFLFVGPGEYLYNLKLLRLDAMFSTDKVLLSLH